MMSYTIYDAQAIGFEADQVLNRNTSLEVYGTSSKGIYLQTANDLTLFLSLEACKGPLSINLSGDAAGLHDLHSRTAAAIQDNKIVFQDSRQEVSLENAVIWAPAPPPDSTGPNQELLADLYQRTKTLVGGNPFFPLLEMVFTATYAPLPGFPDFFRKMTFLKKSLQSGNVPDLVGEIENLIGVGPGLTPLGDDLVLGILLGLNRGKIASLSDSYLAEVNQKVIDLSLDKTTRLSFSLIVCAADGSADERLLKILDGLLSGKIPKDEDLLGMLSWGSTSGFAVLAGMVLALVYSSI